MSIVVAVTKGRRTVVASDSLTCCGSHRETPDNAVTSKVRRIGAAVLGTTGWSLYDNILDEVLHGRRPPPLQTKEQIYRFFNGLWKRLHTRHSFVKDQPPDMDSPFGDLGAWFLVANRNGIFVVSSDLSVWRCRKYYAIGSASYYAFGALYHDYQAERNPERIARRAVEASIHFDINCGGEIQVLNVAGGGAA